MNNQNSPIASFGKQSTFEHRNNFDQPTNSDEIFENDNPPTPTYDELNSDGEAEIDIDSKMATASCIKKVLDDFKVTAIQKFGKYREFEMYFEKHI